MPRLTALLVVVLAFVLVAPAVGIAATQLQTTTGFDIDDWAFAGSNNEVLKQQAPTGSNPYTFSFWFNAEKYGDYGNGDQGTLFAHGTWLWVNGINKNSGQMISLNNNYLKMGHWNNDWTTNFAPQLNKWYYLTVAYDGTTEKLYIDGVLTDSKEVGSLNVQPSDIYIGSMMPHPYGWVSYYFNGKIGKDVKILSSALNDAETAAAYEEANSAANFPAVILPQETVYLYGYSDYSYYNSPHDNEYLRHIFYRTLVYEDGTREIIDSYNSIPDKGEMKINAYGSSGNTKVCGVWTGVEGSATYNFECWASYYVGYYDGIVPEKTVKISKPGNYRVELKDIVLPPATAGRYPNITLQSTIDYWMDYDINAYQNGYTNCKENVYPNTGSTWHEHAFYSHCQGDKKLFSGIKPTDLPKDNPIFSDGTITSNELSTSFYAGMPKALHDTLKSYEFTVVQPVTIEGFKVCSNNDFNACKPAKFANQPAYIFPVVKATNPYEIKITIGSQTYTGTAAFTPKTAGKYTLTFKATDLVNGDIDSQSQDITFAPAFVLSTSKSKTPFEPAAGGAGSTATGAIPAVPLNGNTAVALLAGVGAVGAGLYLFKNKNNPSKLHITGLKTVLTNYGRQQDAAREGVKEQMRLAQKSLEAYKKWKEEQERASNSNGYYAKHYLSLLAKAKSLADKKLYTEEAQKFLKADGYSTAEAKSIVKTFTTPSIFGSPAVAKKDFDDYRNKILSGQFTQPAKTEKKPQQKGIIESVTGAISDFIGNAFNSFAGAIAGIFNGSSKTAKYSGIKTAKAVSMKMPMGGVKNTEANKENNSFKGFGGGKSGGGGTGRGYKDPFDKKILPIPLIAIATGAIATGAATLAAVTATPAIAALGITIAVVGVAYTATNPNSSKAIEGVLGQVTSTANKFGKDISGNLFERITIPKTFNNFALPKLSLFDPVPVSTDIEFVNEGDEIGVKIYTRPLVPLLAAIKLENTLEKVVTEEIVPVDKNLDIKIQTLVRYDNPLVTSFGIGLIAVKEENLIDSDPEIFKNELK